MEPLALMHHPVRLCYVVTDLQTVPKKRSRWGIATVPADDRSHRSLAEHEFGRNFQIAEPAGFFGQHSSLHRRGFFAVLGRSPDQLGHGHPPPSLRRTISRETPVL